MFGCGYFCDNGQSCLLFRFAEPDEALLSPALESIGAGTRFPDAAAQHGYLRDLRQGVGGSEDLFFAFHATGAGDDYRFFVCKSRG